MPVLATLSRRVHLAESILLVDGLARAGKNLLAPILSSFERVEIERAEEIFEYIGTLYRMDKMSRDAAIAMLRTLLDLHLYNGMISRNTNFRPGDDSSVLRCGRPWLYFRRLWQETGAAVIERTRRERPIHQNITHDQLMNFPLYHEAFGKRLKMIEMIRHPVNLVDAWLRRGWGVRFGQDPTALTLCISHGDQDLPHYALGWEEKYLACHPAERVIRIIDRLWRENMRVHDGLPAAQQAQVLFISLEDFMQRTPLYLAVLERFLGSRTTRRTGRILHRQRCPRSLKTDEERRREAALRAQTGAEGNALLDRLIADHATLAARIAPPAGA